VADYVLGKLTPKDLEAVQRVVPEVVDLLVKEMYREGDD
jgi:peptidyl-tRNA hydrolase